MNDEGEVKKSRKSEKEGSLAHEEKEEEEHTRSGGSGEDIFSYLVSFCLLHTKSELRP